MRTTILVVTLVAAVGCQEKKTTFPENPPPQKPAEKTRATPVVSPNLSAEAQSQVNVALDAYDDVRGLLSNDQTEGVAAAAGRIETAATNAAASAVEPSDAKLKAIASAATKLKSATDLEQSRAAFAEVSRSVVEFLEAEPALAQQRYLFTCPMAKGYPKWVQSTEALGNPYMGKKMLACGEAAKWKS